MLWIRIGICIGSEFNGGPWIRNPDPGLYGNCSSQPPHLTEELPQWLSGPSLVLPTAEFPTGNQTGSNSVLRAAIFYSTIGIG